MVTKLNTFTVFNSLLMILFAFLSAYPMWYILVLSFNEGADAAMGGIYWWPRSFTIGNYIVILQNEIILNAFKISVLRTAIGTIGSLLVTSMVAYALSRKELPGRKQLTIVFLFIMLFNGGLIPVYIQLIRLDLINSFWVFVIPNLFSVWNMLVMKTSFQNNIPENVIESVKIDGAGYARIYFAIILPFSMPLLAALGLFTAVFHWNDWFTATLYISNAKLLPIQTLLQQILSSNIMSEQMMQTSSAAQSHMASARTITTKSLTMATMMVATIPIILVYPFVQKYFVKGVMVGSLKE